MYGTELKTVVWGQIQAGLILCNLFLCNLALMQLENLHSFSNLQDNFWFSAIWHTQSVATLIFCMRLTESDVNVMPSVMCMDWLCLWYNHAAYIVSSSTAFASFTNMCDKHKTTSPSATQVKNWHNTTSIEEKLDVISWLGKDEKIVDICCNLIRSIPLCYDDYSY
jgi:hypothetical protein